MPRLVIIQGEGKGSVYEFAGEVTLGRASSNTVPLSGSQISRLHARLLPRGDRFVLRDEGSRNGTFVNGQRVRDAERGLATGDEVQIGNVVLVFNPDFEVRPTAQGDASVVLTADDPSATVAIQKALPAEGAAATEALISSGSPGVEVLARRLKTVYEVTRVLTSTMEQGELMRRLLELLVDVFAADRGAILIAPSEGGDLVPEAVVRRGGARADIPISRTVLAEVQARRQAVLSTHAESDPRFDAAKSLVLSTVKAFLCAPFVHQGRFLGVLYIDTQSLVRAFTEDDLQLLANVAAQSAGALVNAAGFVRAREENVALRRRIQEELAIVGESPAMGQVMDRVRRVAETDSTVLIAGDTGTGKELVAQAIHFAGTRRGKPFLPVDCSALSETLLESELFGHEKGAFTGADQMKPGKFELAGGGTLFLDEVGNMSLATQSKLLRVLEERKFTRVGGVKLMPADVRIVAATNADLEQAVRKGAFRQDLYFRLAVVPIALPPMRERREDVPLLARHFLERFAARSGEPPRRLTPAALEALKAYDWPGNVRELRNVLERALVLSERDPLDAEDLPMQGPRVSAPRQDAGPGAAAAEGAAEAKTAGEESLDLPQRVRRVEIDAVRRAMEKADGNKSEAARLLHISRPTLDKKLKEYAIDV